MEDWLLPPVVGPRVLLRAPTVGDEAALVEMATDVRVREYLGGPVDPATAMAKAKRQIGESAWGKFIIVHRGAHKVVGSGDLARKRGPWEVSYQLMYPFWRQGLASEAVSLIRDWFFANTAEHLLIATTQTTNERSRRLLLRLGAVRAGTFQDCGLAQERFEFYRPSAKAGCPRICS